MAPGGCDRTCQALTARPDRDGKRMSTSKITVLAGIAAGQWGMITTAQAGAAGVSAQAVARLAHDDHLGAARAWCLPAGGTPPHPHDEVPALWLHLDPSRAASDRIADGGGSGCLAPVSCRLAGAW
jgi:hypothetical protein